MGFANKEGFVVRSQLSNNRKETNNTVNDWEINQQPFWKANR